MSARPRRRLHAGGWWLWALALGITATRTTNPILLLLIAAVAGYVAITCRPVTPWARAYGSFLKLAAVVLVFRLAIHVGLGGIVGPTVLFTLPEVPLPEWAAGIRIGGAVSAEGLLFALYDGLRLGVLLLCVGAANTLADPRRLLGSLPGALYEVSVAVVVALTTAPQLVAGAIRIRRARQLRGDTRRGVSRFTSLLVPVIEDAFDRSLAMAATMDSRGYGRVGTTSARNRALTGVCVIGGLGALAIGSYGLLDASAPETAGLPVLVLGIVLAGLGLRAGSARATRTRYRPDRWGVTETLIALSGLAALAGVIIAEQTGAGVLLPGFAPIEFPEPPIVAVVGIVIASAPAFFARTPAPPSASVTSAPRPRAIDDAPVREEVPA